MVFSNEDNRERIVINTCNCGCGSEIQVKKFVDDVIPTEYYISLHTSKFEEEQQGVFDIILRRLKRAIFSLLGKDYLYMDIILSEEEMKEFTQKLEEIQK